MIISVSLENWMSFRDRVTFSMIASREHQHMERVPRVEKYRKGILPIATIYGGNASGKTNFFKALNFVRNLVVDGTRPDSFISVDAFRLDAQATNQPTRFSFELLVEEKIYEFSFTVTKKAVLEESLTEITSNSERELYKRQGEIIIFDKKLKNQDFLEFASKGTRDNQLFLTNSVSQKVENFRPIYNWFDDNLQLIAPDSRFEPFERFFNDKHPIYETMNKVLQGLDTGIVKLSGEEIEIDNIHLPQSILVKLQEEVKVGKSARVRVEPRNDRIFVTRNQKSGELSAKRLLAYHPQTDGALIPFEIRQESDGTQRVIDLIPAFIELSKSQSSRVFVVDELDRSLHTLLTRSLIEFYLASCSAKSRSQLLLTTHDVLLMDQQCLRRDEMWVAERDVRGVSSLLSFNEYKDVRKALTIRRSYLQGRLGGIPHIFLGGELSCSEHEQVGGKG